MEFATKSSMSVNCKIWAGCFLILYLRNFVSKIKWNKINAAFFFSLILYVMHCLHLSITILSHGVRIRPPFEQVHTQSGWKTVAEMVCFLIGWLISSLFSVQRPLHVVLYQIRDLWTFLSSRSFRTKLLNFDKVQLMSFFFYGSCFDVIFKNSSANPRSWRLFSCIFV